jgi:protein-disulfide isomerase
MTARIVLAVAISALATPAIARPGDVIRVEHRDPSELPTRGPASAPVTVEVFFTPGWRGNAISNLEKLQAHHPSNIRLVYRVIPSNSARLHYAALEALAQGKFFELMDALAKSIPSSPLTDNRLLELGRQVGLDPVRLDAAIHHPPAAYEKVVTDNERRRKQRLRTSALPAVLYNGHQPDGALVGMTMTDLETAFEDSKAHAEDLVDQGADPAHLTDAFEEERRDWWPKRAGAAKAKPGERDRLGHDELVIRTGPTDEELEQLPVTPELATPPLRTRGMPSYGSPDATVTVVVLCSPRSRNCAKPLHAASTVQDNNPERVRVVWAPFFDVGLDDAADLGLLGDAALCAERVGTSSEVDFDRPASPGWRWTEAVLDETLRPGRQTSSAEDLIDRIARKLNVDRRAFAACRARMAGTSLAFSETARHSGVRTTPATVVGGRVYSPITEPEPLQTLIEEEVSPRNCSVDVGCLHLGDYAPAWRRGL